MKHELTHASFFSGVGGLDLGLERAGWRTVSFSEIDPYASAVLAERWPDVPNLGDIVHLAAERRDGERDEHQRGHRSTADGRHDGRGIPAATLWSGGFPCQDLSVAGKRAGFGGERSSLAFAFLDLVGRHRPPAVLLENVPGLLSSHAGRDFGTLLGTLGELGYGWAYRILDARHFGVPQRRRRVFIVALDLERGLTADGAAEVLSVGSRCPRHPATGGQAGEGVASGADVGADIVGTVPAGLGHHGQSGTSAQAVAAGHVVADVSPGLLTRGDHHRDHSEQAYVVGPPPDADRVRAADGLAGRVDGGGGVADTLNSGGNDGGFRTEPGAHLDAFDYLNTGSAFGEVEAGSIPSRQGWSIYTKSRRAQSDQDDETWVEGEVMPTLNSFDVGDARTTAAVLDTAPSDDPLLPLGLDSHRYRTCGNGVVSSVSEFIGHRLIEVLSGEGLPAELVR